MSMKYVTDRKRAQGLGASRQGTHHHWQMMMTSIALVVIVPVFIMTFGYGLGGTYEEVIAYFSKPFPALVLAVSIIVIVYHTMQETLVAIEDYVPGKAGKLTIVAVTAFGYLLMLTGLFAVAKIAL
ncbi:succinate dehydrogenase, hydrophobic membrane anchor protein [Yoonia sp. BS5-3]|uniref:Succinate dehydrogenase hydrophobic membrane anchor subunit n=1 Tax=Yoonia phaeophyticola TaxID=3137369 RepID=A0ABZ2V450_9RHOB